MPKCSPSPDRVNDALAAIARATEALFKHTTKAVDIQDRTTRTTGAMTTAAVILSNA